MSGPRVSICIPTYDRPEGLRVAIESVLEQGVDDLEIVVSDNHTSAQDVVETLGDQRVRYVANETNVGAAKNAELALDRSRGELLGVLHDDDRLLPGYLEAVVTAFNEDPTLGVAFTNHYFDDGSRLAKRECQLQGGTYNAFLEPLLEFLPVPITATIMRRTVWLESRPLPDLLSVDYVIFVRAAIAGWPFRYIDEPLMVYRVHPNQLTNASSRATEDAVALWEMFEFTDDRCEAWRRRRLALALVGRAATCIRTNRLPEARADLDRAMSLDESFTGIEARLLRLAADSGVIGASLRGGLRVRRLSKAVWSDVWRPKP